MQLLAQDMAWEQSWSTEMVSLRHAFSRHSSLVFLASQKHPELLHRIDVWISAWRLLAEVLLAAQQPGCAWSLGQCGFHIVFRVW